MPCNPRSSRSKPNKRLVESTHRVLRKVLTYGTRVPSTPSDLEPGEVAAQRGGAEDGIRVLLELLVRDCLVYSNLFPTVSMEACRDVKGDRTTHGIVGGANSKERYSHR